MMNNRVINVLTGIFWAIVLIAIFITNNYALIGLLIGFQTGIINVQWLFRDISKALDMELSTALKKYHFSLLSRLGMITLVVAVISRFQPEWLYFFVWGIAMGIITPMILTIMQKIKRGRG